MSNNASDLASNSICLDGGTEKRIPALGDGSLLPGSAVTIDTSNGKIEASDAGATDEFVGLLEKRYDEDIDTAPGDGDAVDIIVPKQGKDYIVRVDSENTSNGHAGKPLELSETSNGEFMDAADLGDNVMCRLARDHDTDDDFTIVTWGAA